MNQRVTIVTDLGFGDAGKGSLVDYLARVETDAGESVTTVVRFNGGSQAGHNVVTPEGRHHTFRQFGSATLVPGVRTHLSRFMLVNPLRLWQEAEELAGKGAADAICRLSIDENALVISPYHEAANRIRESLRDASLRGDGRHGSCGQGIGETAADHQASAADSLTVGDLRCVRTATEKLESIRRRKRDEFAPHFPKLWQSGHLKLWQANSQEEEGIQQGIQTLLDPFFTQEVVAFYGTFTSRVRIVSGDHLSDLLKSGHVVFEGSQGVLLDEWYGFHPYTTWSTTTNANAETLLREAGYDGEVTRLGLLRAYSTRHGAGPFVTEDAELTAALPDPHNPVNPWQGSFRVGAFDTVMARYALSVVGPIDGLVISNLDRLRGLADIKVCTAYEDDQFRRFKCPTRSPAPDLVYQAQLTQYLDACRPRLQLFKEGIFEEHDTEAYLEFIESELNTPVVIASSGPDATGKWRRS